MIKIGIVKLQDKQWSLYKQIRLKALQTDPVAFADSYNKANAYPDKFWQQKLSKPGNIWLFAKYEQDLIGMIGAYTKDYGELDGVAAIVGVYVDPAYRGEGVGTLLMQSIIDELKKFQEIKKAKIWVSETQGPAMELYKSWGFKLIGNNQQKIFFQGNYFDELILEKNLYG